MEKYHVRHMTHGLELWTRDDVKMKLTTRSIIPEGSNDNFLTPGYLISMGATSFFEPIHLCVGFHLTLLLYGVRCVWWQPHSFRSLTCV